MPENNAPNPNQNSNPPASNKPVNPQMETVLMNQPASQVPSSGPQVPSSKFQMPSQASQSSPQQTQAVPPATPPVKPSGPGAPIPPKKIGNEKSVASKRKFLLGCFGGFIFLFVIFIVLMVLMIARSGATNPIIAAFGLDSNGIRAFLQGTVGFTFGLFSLLFLVLAVIGLFRYLGAQKNDKEKRRHNARLSLLSGAALIFLVFIWVLLATYISRIQINVVNVAAEILVVEPEDMTNLQAPVEIRFSAENVAKALNQGGLTIEAMNWDLDGDSTFETPVTEAQITRIYRQRGTYNVGLQVKIQGEEEFRVFNKPIFIETAVFDAEPSTGSPPIEIQFDASNIVSENEMSSLDWDFDGDGRFDLQGPDNLRPRYTFDQIGTYNVLLRAVDKNGNLERYTRRIEITANDSPLLSAKINATPGFTGMAPFQVRFDGSESESLKGNVTSYEWDFGDGSELQSGRSVSHTYSTPGIYEVILMIEDDLGTQAQTKVEVEVESTSSKPQPVILTVPAVGMDDPMLTGTLPFKVAFDASKSLDTDNDIVEYEWDFDGDGKVDAQGAKVNHTFDQEGQFEVTLTLTDAQNQTSTGQIMVSVEEPAVNALIKATPQEGTAPLVVQFDGSASTTFQGNIVSYEWDFGDGSPKTITAANVSHKYDKVGTYDVTLKVLTSQNESGASTMQIFVREISLKACFNASRNSGPAPLTVTFNSKCSSGAIKQYQWQFGDGDESANMNPTHTFETPGTYNVNLEITDDKNNVGTVQETIVVE